MKNEFYTLITGASRGIGKAIAGEMALRGHNLILHSLPGEHLSTFSSQLMEDHNVKIRYFEIDLTEHDGPFKLFSLVKAEGLKINILVNNAGIGIEGPAETCSNKDIDNILSLNVRAITLLTTFFIPDLKQTSSYILNISRLGSFIPTPYKSVYLASKSYIFYFTRALDAELKGSSVKTCIFAPGGVRTNKKVLERIEHAGWLSKSSSISPEEVAKHGLKAMFKGKKVVIPGRLSSLIFTLGLFIPEGIILAVTRKLFKRELSA